MGALVDGIWRTDDVRHSANGRFVHPSSAVRNWITADGTAGSTGGAGFKAGMDRYHLYVSLGCPFAHRTLIFRSLKGLESGISVSGVNPIKGENGWTFEPAAGVDGDPIFAARYLYEIYVKADPSYSGRVSVPVLWDKERETMVSNDSGDIIRMFNRAFDHLGARSGDYCPDPTRGDVDALNEYIYEHINIGVYKAGFAKSQSVHEEAVNRLFGSLENLEERISKQRFLFGDQVTETDWRLFTTLLRFDAVYHIHFKCNRRRLVDFPNLWAYTRDLYQQPGIAKTVDLPHIKQHYFCSHRHLNPSGLVPIGPDIDFDAPPDRQHLARAADLPQDGSARSDPRQVTPSR